MLFLVDRIYKYGGSVGDTLVTTLSDITFERASHYVKVPHGLPIAGNQLVSYLYVRH